jgi:uncharacterized RDD family membrane protein YckC
MTGHETWALPQQAEAFQGQPAGLVSRSLAVVVDVVVVGTVLVAGYLAVSVVIFAWNPRTFSFPAPSEWFTIVAAAAVAVVYLTVGWWVTGRSYGCAVMGLRVVGRRHRDVRFLAALARAVLCLLFPLGLGWCAVDRQDRAVHDLLTRTRVVHDWRRRER